MEFLKHNFIADMRGPEFLGLYAAVAFFMVVICWICASRKDPTRGLKPPAIPPKLDPYEVAFLRGGENEALRLLLLSLIHRGYLEITGDKEKTIRQKRGNPDPRHLNATEATVFGWFRTEQKAADIFTLASATTEFTDWCAQFESRLRTEQLLSEPPAKRAMLIVATCGALVLLALGGYKLAIALSRGRSNVGFLIALMVISTIVVFAVSYASVGRVSARGKSWLERLELAFEKLKSRAVSATAQADDAALLLLVSTYGISVLEDTIYSSYPKMFKRAAERGGGGGSCGSGWSGSGCGSSCSSGSSCGGGGGGGGCGGCGGGGD